MDCSQTARVDLHIHTTASDGTLTPAEIVHLASEQGLKAIAITDHDTLDGAGDALAVADGTAPVEVLAGVEISAATPSFYPRPGSIHILGYGIRLDDAPLNDALSRLRDARKNRNPRIIQRLNALGFALTLTEVTEHAGACQLSRPHIAQTMVKKGYAGSLDEVFERYLRVGCPAYVDKFRVGCAEAIELIRGAGGIAVLAHPGLLKPVRNLSWDELIRKLKEIGLQGLEVYYPEHSPGRTARLTALAKQYGLLMTGGTDFHGAVRPDMPLGGGTGFCVPCTAYDSLRRALANGRTTAAD